MQHYPKLKLNATQTRTCLLLLTLRSIALFIIAGIFFMGVHVVRSMLLCFYVTYFNFMFQWYCFVFLDVDFSAISVNIKFDLSCKILKEFRQI